MEGKSIGDALKRGGRDALIGGTIGAVTGGAGAKVKNYLKTRNVSKQIHTGKQGKHIPGHKNRQEGKSILNEDAQSLLDDFHSGRVKSSQKINDIKTRVDFGKEIGEHVQNGVSTPTTKGIIHNSKNGAHIVPARQD